MAPYPPKALSQREHSHGEPSRPPLQLSYRSELQVKRCDVARLRSEPQSKSSSVSHQGSTDVTKFDNSAVASGSRKRNNNALESSMADLLRGVGGWVAEAHSSAHMDVEGFMRGAGAQDFVVCENLKHPAHTSIGFLLSKSTEVNDSSRTQRMSMSQKGSTLSSVEQKATTSTVQATTRPERA